MVHAASTAGTRSTEIKLEIHRLPVEAASEGGLHAFGERTRLLRWLMTTCAVD
jgi:hypothetical protein